MLRVRIFCVIYMYLQIASILNRIFFSHTLEFLAGFLMSNLVCYPMMLVKTIESYKIFSLLLILWSTCDFIYMYIDTIERLIVIHWAVDQCSYSKYCFLLLLLPSLHHFFPCFCCCFHWHL